jgi:8-amino-7-oxononanoate synthase
MTSISARPSMLDRLSAALAELRAADQFRELARTEGIPFHSNDYLGLSTHPLLKEAVVRAIAEDERVASTGSRLLSGNHERWERVEAEFAQFAGAEASLHFPSGYAANIGLLSSLLKAGDTVFSDSANHASLIDGIRLSRADRVIFPHLDLNFLEDALRRAPTGGARLIVVESIFSMDGDRAPLDDLLGLCERHNAYLIVDEAHSTGVEGVTRRSPRLLATVHTCGKALASVGAFVAGARTLKEFLINHARPFIFTTALPAYCAAQVRMSLDLATQANAERKRLAERSQRLREGLSIAGFDIGGSSSQIVPVILGSNENAIRYASALREAGFAVRPIRPPTVPPGSARLRLSLTASLSTANIDALLDVLRSIQR